MLYLLPARRRELRDWLEDAKAPKIAHDAKTLRLSLREPLSTDENEVSVCGIVADTFLMAYLLDPAHQVHPVAEISRKISAKIASGTTRSAQTGQKSEKNGSDFAF